MSRFCRISTSTIDVVGTADLRPSFIGTVKWRAQTLDQRVARDLERDAAVLGIDERAPRLMIGRGGCERSVMAEVFAPVRGSYTVTSMPRRSVTIPAT